MIPGLRFIFGYILSEKRHLLLGLLMTSGVSLSAWVVPRVIAWVIDGGITTGNHDVVIKGVALLALAEGVRLSCFGGSQFAYSKLGQNVIEKIRIKLVKHLLSLPIPYFDKATSGGLMTRVVNDANSLTDFFQSGFVSIIGNIGSLIAAFLGLYGLHHQLSFVLIGATLPFCALCVWFSIKLRKVYDQVRTRLSDLNSVLADYLFGMKTIRALGMSSLSHRRLVKQVERYAEAQMGMVRTFALFHPTVTLAVGTLLLLSVNIGLPLVARGEMKVGAWVGALSYILMMQQPLVEISDRWNFFLAGITSINRIREVLSVGAEVSQGTDVGEMNSIVFNKTSFYYDGSATPALDEVSLEIHKGDWIGVYGESGSGKSTFLQMLYGFYSPKDGEICWNGQGYLKCNLQSLRKQFGVVEQFPFLFAGTLAENITLFGRFPLNCDELKNEFSEYPLIFSLLNQLDLQISERGSNLSMGQKQMITFLRAYVSKPSIWILDEATAFFDPLAEKELFRALEQTRSQRSTVIQVAHREQALSRMNRLLKVQKGKIRELGPVKP